MHIAFCAPLWLWNGKAAWTFITLPEADSAIIKLVVPRRGWGSVRVKAQVGASEWATSIFPDTKSGCYLLPVKAAIRKAEAIKPGDTIEIALKLDL